MGGQVCNRKQVACHARLAMPFLPEHLHVDEMPLSFSHRKPPASCYHEAYIIAQHYAPCLSGAKLQARHHGSSLLSIFKMFSSTPSPSQLLCRVRESGRPWVHLRLHLVTLCPWEPVSLTGAVLR